MGERDSTFLPVFWSQANFSCFIPGFPDRISCQNKTGTAHPASHAPRSGNPRLKQMVTYECGQAFVVP